MIHIACFDISQLDRTAYETLYALASPERQARANGYRRQEDAYRCIAAEALLRHAAGTASNPAILRDPNGKPRINDRENFHFNLSHSGRWVVISWGGSEVGIDVEQPRENTDFLKITRRHFTPEEQAYVFQSPDEQSRRFLEIWTKKECYLKYLGTGLTHPLNTFSTLSLPDLFCHTLHLRDGSCLSLCTPEKSWDLTELLAEELLSQIP